MSYFIYVILAVKFIQMADGTLNIMLQPMTVCT